MLQESDYWRHDNSRQNLDQEASRLSANERPYLDALPIVLVHQTSIENIFLSPMF